MVDVSIRLSSSLSPCYLIIFACLSVTATTRRRGITLSEDFYSARQGSGSSGEPSHILTAISASVSSWVSVKWAKYSGINYSLSFVNFPESIKISRHVNLPRNCQSIADKNRYCIHWTLKWTDLVKNRLQLSMALVTRCLCLLITAVVRAASGQQRDSLASYSPAFSPSVTGVLTSDGDLMSDLIMAIICRLLRADLSTSRAEVRGVFLSDKWGMLGLNTFL